MKRVFQKTFVLLLMTTFRVMSYIPFIGKFGRLMYASCLAGSADGLYFGERYQKAIKEYEHFLHYAHGLEESPILAFQFSRAHEILALMYEKGLGTNKNELKVEDIIFVPAAGVMEHMNIMLQPGPGMKLIQNKHTQPFMLFALLTGRAKARVF